LSARAKALAWPREAKARTYLDFMN